jgi:acetyl-CoA acetyltransferase
MGLGPVPATQKLLGRLGWTASEVGAIELNEAFAVQSIAVIRRLKLDEDRVNADGGAIARATRSAALALGWSSPS